MVSSRIPLILKKIGFSFLDYSGALSAIRSHWVVSNEPATIVLPTGTGKSETIFSTIVSERIAATLIVVPSNLLREQLFDQVKHLGILPKISVVSDQAIFPNCLL